MSLKRQDINNSNSMRGAMQDEQENQNKVKGRRV